VSEQPIAGACVCGAVQYTVRPPFMAFQFCHCSRCRKATGSAHATNLFVKTEQLTWEAGEDHVRRYELPEAKYWSHCFCDTCGSSLPWLSRTGKAYIIPAGTLDDDPGMKPDRNIYFGSRAPWYVHASDLETFEEMPPRK
jgi:hypothetical protein